MGDDSESSQAVVVRLPLVLGVLNQSLSLLSSSPSWSSGLEEV